MQQDAEDHGLQNANPGKETNPMLDSLGILIAWRRFIIVNYLAVSVLVVIIVFLLPKWYRATASILPPKDQTMQNLFGGSSSLLKGLSISKLGGGQGAGVYNYLAILKSRSTMEEVVEKFNLIDVYDVSKRSMELAIKELRDNTSFEIQDEENINIEVLDKDPQRAADVANYFVQILNRRSIELATAEARNNREFIEKRVNELRDSLQFAENKLKDFQKQAGMVITPEQSASMSAVAELYAMKAKRELETAILAKMVSPDNELLRQYTIELAELTKKLSGIPETGLISIRLYRDVITYQKILEFLIPMFEQAKINEQKDLPVLLVLDKAIPPEYKVKPQRILIILSVSTIWLMFLVVIVYLFHGISLRGNEMKPGTKILVTWAQRIAALYRVKINT
jgi:tyrosine-protein kinase Etk/Wzc